MRFKHVKPNFCWNNPISAPACTCSHAYNTQPQLPAMCGANQALGEVPCKQGGVGSYTPPSVLDPGEAGVLETHPHHFETW